MKFGICGYGNLGKTVEEVILSSGQDEIVGIFSRRKGVTSQRGIKVYQFEDAPKFEGKIDVMIMCGGSQEDLIWQSPEMLKHFDIIDTFDTHARITEHRKNLQKVSEEFGHSAIYSCGWDPGLFSIARVLFANVFGSSPQTFWGRGVSQGHSEALRNIAGIKDAIQFTVPNEDVLKRVKEEGYQPNENEKHIRECHISLDGTRSLDEIKCQIFDTENYFKGQNVVVIEESEEEIRQLRQRMFHKGLVFGCDQHSKMEFTVEMDCNPLFTAKIVLAFAPTLRHLPRGVYSVLDVPIGKIGVLDNFKML